MFSWLANAWRVPELRRRLLFTAVILAAYRLGSWMPAPGVDSAQIQNFFNGRGGSLLGLLNLFSGSALSRFSIFALGIMPYVTASIILQLMTVVVPSLEQLQKEGEAGYAEDQPVHALPDRRARRGAGDGVRLPLPPAGRAAREPRPARADHRHADRRDDAADVHGRADHQARHRQRDLAADLRVDPHLGTGRHQRVAQRRAAREAVLPARSRSASSSRSSSCRRASAASRSSTRSGWSGVARRQAARPTCRCA